MGNIMRIMGDNAEHEGMGGPGSDPEGTGTDQGGHSGESDTPGGQPNPWAKPINNYTAPNVKAAMKQNFVSPALGYSAPPQQTDIQNNFSTSSQYAQRYGLGGRVHF